jgi:hypothetical protein
MASKTADQHTWVWACKARYEEQGLEPGNPEDGDWQEAHYPAPKCGGGTETIWLRFEDHQVQGILQSEEYGRMCFFPRDAKSFLDNHWCQDWFELYSFYEKWAGHNAKVNAPTMNDHENTQKARSANGKATGPVNVVAMNDHDNTRKNRSANGKATGPANGPGNLSKIPKETLANNGRVNGPSNITKIPRETLAGNGKSTNKQRWQCLVTGYASNPGGLTSYQRARGIDTALRVRLDD